MKRVRILTLFFLIPGVLFAQGGNLITEMQTEHLTNPLGIDVPHPRLSWAAAEGTNPIAYVVGVGTDSAEVARGEGAIWVAPSETKQLVVYNGPALKPFTRYYWSVIPYDHEGRIHNITRMRVAWFETGMMEQGNWRGSWVTDGLGTFLYTNFFLWNFPERASYQGHVNQIDRAGPNNQLCRRRDAFRLRAPPPASLLNPGLSGQPTTRT